MMEQTLTISHITLGIADASGSKSTDISTQAVIAAAASGDEDVFKAVLAAKGDASCQDETTGLSPLMAAAAAGHGTIVSLLLQVVSSIKSSY